MSFFDLNDEDFEVCGDLTRLVVLGENSEIGVIKRKAGPETAELRNDHPPSEQFVYMLEGRARITVGDESKIVEVGQAVYIPMDTPHSIAALTAIRYVTFYAPTRQSSLRDAAKGRKAVFHGVSGESAKASA